MLKFQLSTQTDFFVFYEKPGKKFSINFFSDRECVSVSLSQCERASVCVYRSEKEGMREIERGCAMHKDLETF